MITILFRLSIELYFKPWAGIGYTTQIAGSKRLGSRTYHLAPVTMFATLQAGYTF